MRKKLWEKLFAFSLWKRKQIKTLQIFICNYFRADGAAVCLVGACLVTGDLIFVIGSDNVSRCVLRSCACFCLISGQTIVVCNGHRSPKHIAIISFLRSCLSPLSFLLGWGRLPRQHVPATAVCKLGAVQRQLVLPAVFVNFSETGRIRFRRARSQWVFWGLTEFRGASSVSSSRSIICVPKRTHRVCRKTQWGSVSSLLRNSTLETVFRHRFLMSFNLQSPALECPIETRRENRQKSGLLWPRLLQCT